MPAGRRSITPTARPAGRASRYDADGLVPAIVQEEGTGEVLMMAWMNEATLRQTLEEGRTVFWSRSRQEVWRKGDTSGDRQCVRAGVLRLRRRHAAVRGRAGGPGGLPHRRPHLLLPVLRRRVRRELSRDPAEPGRVPGPGPASTVVPVWRELLADLITPVAAFARLTRRSTPARLPARVGRARRAVGTVLVRRPGAVGHARRPRRPHRGRRRPSRRRCRSTPACSPRSRAARGLPLAVASRAAAAARRAGRLPRLRRRARGRAPARRARGRPGLPGRRPVDHRRAGRLRPLAPAGVAHRQRDGGRGRPTPTTLDARLRRGGGPPRAAGRRRRPAARRAAGRAARPRRAAARGALDDAERALRARGRGGARAHPRRRHLPGRAGPALRPRPRRRAVRRLPGAAPGQPEPVHVLPPPPRGHPGRVVARADGAAARRPGDLPPDRRHPPPRPHRRGRPPAGRRAAPSTRRRSPST